MKEQMREAFEAWWGQAPIQLEPLKPRSINENVSAWAWQAWQAALSAVPAESRNPLQLNTDSAREYLFENLLPKFSDSTFAYYVRNELAGDFAYQLAKYLQAQQPAQEPTEPKLSQRLIDTFQELNMGNYGDDDVRQLNDWAIEAYTALAATTQEPVKQESNVFIDVNFMLPEMNTPVLGLVGKNLYALARVDYDEDAGWLWAVGGGDLSDIRNYEADDDYQPSCWIPMPLPLPPVKDVTE